MVDVRYPVEAGHFVRKQIQSGDRLIAWSHRRRLHTGLTFARPFFRGRVWLVPRKR
jgi:hypothetical protein